MIREGEGRRGREGVRGGKGLGLARGGNCLHGQGGDRRPWKTAV
jgi:hypothetical protein